MERSYHLLNLCRKIQETEGINWKISKERRDLDRKLQEEKTERLERGAIKKKQIQEKTNTKLKQQKITSQLAKLPENRRIMVERELETERKLNLKEAKEELWRRWRQKKGRTEYKKKTTKEEENINLDRKIERIELELKKYEEELENEMVEILETVENREKKLEKKRKKEQHWEMLAWP